MRLRRKIIALSNLTTRAGITRSQGRGADHEKPWHWMIQYQPESWRNADSKAMQADFGNQRSAICTDASKDWNPDVREQTKVLELLGRVNYKIIKGSKVYIEVDGIVYKTLYGGYWRSVFTGVEHYLLRCQQVSGAWAEESLTAKAVDLPIAYSNEGWTARGHSLSFVLARE